MTELIPILLFTTSTMITPGPNNFMLLNSGLHHGIKQSLPHFFGICLGFPLMVLIVALGFGVVFIKYPWLKQSLKIIGSLYMLYLAWQVLRAHASSASKYKRKPFGFIKAVLFQWINPKAWLMAIGAISIFSLNPNYIYNAFFISLLFFIVGLPCLGIWLVFGSFLQRILKKESHQRYFNAVMAFCLAVSVVLIWIE